MHADPGKPGSLGVLARAAAMSRTSFADRFRTVAGVPPLTYLGRWRMLLVQRPLRDGDARVATLASELGCTSERAFKRDVGLSPLRYRQRLRTPGPTRAPASWRFRCWTPRRSWRVRRRGRHCGSTSASAGEGDSRDREHAGVLAARVEHGQRSTRRFPGPGSDSPAEPGRSRFPSWHRARRPLPGGTGCKPCSTKPVPTS
ncbi:helix-turn-helix domain-containing protein [Amycolatopsis saalfeldensis]|uniref:helix-turn-helix domain-containing protein n=1 Tax=Amycolatopsis saalfeldensis TaxID=394193 RepID=UPI003CCBCBCA